MTIEDAVTNRYPTVRRGRERVLAVILGFVAALGLTVHTCGCAHMPEPRHAVLAAEVLLANVAPLCAGSPSPDACKLLPRATQEVARARALLDEGHVEAARDVLARAGDSLEVLAELLRGAP